MYSDWKTIRTLHDERVSRYTQCALEGEPKFSLWPRIHIGTAIRPIAGRLVRLLQSLRPRETEKRRERRHVEWV
jgi:hypothetical protein